MRAAKHAAAEIEKLVERRSDVVAKPEIVAEINQTIAAVEALADQIMDTRQAARFTVDRPDSPNPSSVTQMCKFFS
jgi:uncharacterized protein Yka (UPF0111/DUF47 family)